MNEIQDEYREYRKLCRVEDDPGVSGLAHLESRIRNALTLPRKGYQSTFTNAINALNELLAYVAVADLKANKFYAHERDDLVRHIAERDETIRQLQANLGNLLAVIHRDGGHYQAAHGAAKAVEDAIKVVVMERNAQLDEIAELRAELVRKADEMRAHERASVVAVIEQINIGAGVTYLSVAPKTPLPPAGTELIARPAIDPWSEMNARNIAAAPDLAEALKEARPCVEEIADQVDCTAPHKAASIYALLARIDALLAKANGGGNG